MARKKASVSKARLEELIEEGTVDCYDIEEEYSGLLTMVEDHLEFPFEAFVSGEWIEFTGMVWGEEEEDFDLKFSYKLGRETHYVDAASIEWGDDPPEGYEWVEAYLAWLGYA